MASITGLTAPALRGPMAAWSIHSRCITLPHLLPRHYLWYVYPAPLPMSSPLPIVCLLSLPTVASRSPHSLRLSMIYHTYTICPSRSPITRPFLKVSSPAPILSYNILTARRYLVYKVTGGGRIVAVMSKNLHSRRKFITLWECLTFHELLVACIVRISYEE